MFTQQSKESINVMPIFLQQVPTQVPSMPSCNSPTTPVRAPRTVADFFGDLWGWADDFGCHLTVVCSQINMCTVWSVWLRYLREYYIPPFTVSVFVVTLDDRFSDQVPANCLWDWWFVGGVWWYVMINYDGSWVMVDMMMIGLTGDTVQWYSWMMLIDVI